MPSTRDERPKPSIRIKATIRTIQFELEAKDARHLLEYLREINEAYRDVNEASPQLERIERRLDGAMKTIPRTR